MSTLNVTNLKNITAGVTNVSLLADGSTTLVLNATGTSRTGGIRYAGGNLEVYNGAAWVTAGGAGTVTGVTATAPLAVATGTTTPVISITPGTSRQLLETNGSAVQFASNIDIPGTLDVTGVATFDGIASHPLGTAAAPSVTFTGDTDTGIYSAGSGRLSVANNGVNTVEVTAAGDVLIGGTLPASPNITLASSGLITLGGTSPGIQFPTTAIASANANTLDDYEEGTWTPTYVSGLASGGFTSTTGTYTKTGNVVVARMSTFFTVAGGTAQLNGPLIIGSLPFAAAVVNGGPTVGGENNFGQQLPFIVSSTSTGGNQLVINASTYPTSATMNKLDATAIYLTA
jgi:hypothetical protein